MAAETKNPGGGKIRRGKTDDCKGVMVKETMKVDAIIQVGCLEGEIGGQWNRGEHHD